jgi:hypothetical protein
MTKVSPAPRCDGCDGLLVPPEMTDASTVPSGTEYVCLRCGRPYRWVGRPPQLVTMRVETRIRDDDQE